VFSGSLVALIVFFFIGPLDDILFVSIVSKFLFQLSWLESLLISCVVGVLVFLFLELKD